MNYIYRFFNYDPPVDQNIRPAESFHVGRKVKVVTEPLPAPSGLGQFYKTVETKRFDMAMVYDTRETNRNLEAYLKNLESAGLEVEKEVSHIFPHLRAALIRGSDNTLTHYSRLYAYELTKDNPNFVWVEIPTCKLWRTQLTHPTDQYIDLLRRAQSAVTRQRPTTFTNIERIMIVNRVMINTHYYDEHGDTRYGYESMKGHLDVYALHDSTRRWSETGRLQDRQLLLKYWANLQCLFKVQPIFMVEKYFGTEAAFYFVFSGFFNKMMLPLTALGLVAFVLGLLGLTSPELRELCKLDIPVCPICQDFNLCPIDSLKKHCTAKAFAMLFDNTASVVFAFISSLWSILFLILWKREQATMALRWNVRRIKYEEELRPEFVAKATVMKISRFTQKQTIDIPMSLKIRGYVLSYVSIVILLCCSVLLILLTAFYRKTVHVLKATQPAKTEILITISASYIYYLVVTFAVSPVVKKLAVALTIQECHRSQKSYDCSIVYKECLLSIPSFYGVMIYLSLFKGKYFIYPTEAANWTVAGGIPADTCNPAGCMIDVTVQYIVMMSTDMFIMMYRTIFEMYYSFSVKVQTRSHFKQLNDHRLFAQRWEKDYVKRPSSRTMYVGNYRGMMITYGLITWFAAICPLGPLFAVIRNLVELRLRAFEALVSKRREIGVKISDIGCWNNILLMTTMMGIVSNGVTIAFSSSFIPRYLYMSMNNFSLKGYVQKSFSSFDTKKFSKISGVVLPDGNISSVCYYRGYQFDMDNKDKFRETNSYWFHLILQIGFLLFYENSMFLIAAIMFLIIPATPNDVRLKYMDEEDEIREKRIELLNARFYKQNRRQALG